MCFNCWSVFRRVPMPARRTASRIQGSLQKTSIRLDSINTQSVILLPHVCFRMHVRVQSALHCLIAPIAAQWVRSLKNCSTKRSICRINTVSCNLSTACRFSIALKSRSWISRRTRTQVKMRMWNCNMWRCNMCVCSPATFIRNCLIRLRHLPAFEQSHHC